MIELSGVFSKPHCKTLVSSFYCLFDHALCCDLTPSRDQCIRNLYPLASYRKMDGVSPKNGTP